MGASRTEYMREYMREYRKTRREKVNEWERLRYAKHLEERRARLRAQIARDPEKHRERSRQWRKSNPDKVGAQRARRRTLYSKVTCSLTKAQWDEILEAFGYRCAYCSRTDVPLGMDHVIPLSRGGPHTRENVVPCCRSCNSRKGTRSVEAVFGVGPR